MALKAEPLIMLLKTKNLGDLNFLLVISTVFYISTTVFIRFLVDLLGFFSPYIFM